MKRLFTAALASSAMLAIPVAPAIAGTHARAHATGPNAVCQVYNARLAKLDHAHKQPVAYFRGEGHIYLAEAARLGHAHVDAGARSRYRTLVSDFRSVGRGFLVLANDDATNHQGAGDVKLRKIFKVEDRLLKISESLQLFNCYA